MLGEKSQKFKEGKKIHVQALWLQTNLKEAYPEEIAEIHKKKGKKIWRSVSCSSKHEEDNWRAWKVG